MPHHGAVVSGSDRVMSGCRIKIHGPHLTHNTVGSGRVRFGYFIYNFRVGSDFFLIWVNILVARPPITRWGQVRFLHMGTS